MAASLITKIPPYIFPFQVDRLEIQTQANADCKVMLEVDYLPILSAHLTAGHNGVVTLDDLQPLVSETAEACGAMPVHFSVSADGVELGTASILPCRHRLDLSAEDVAKKYFLSAAMGRMRMISDTALLHLSWAALADDGELKLIVYWYSPTLKAATHTVHYPEVTEMDEIYRTATVDVSNLTPPEDYGYRIMRMEACCGLRTQTYTFPADGLSVGETHEVEYTNLFMLPDTLLLTGTAIEEEHNTYTTARLNGRLQNVRVTGEPSVKCQSGPLHDGDLNVLRDLALSRAAAVKGRNIIVTGVECKHKKTDSDLIEAEITWKYADSSYTFASGHTPRIFDEKFDYSFN